MSQPYYAIKPRLPAALKDRLEDWELLASRHPDTDELLRSIGIEVSRNFRRDGALSRNGVRNFLQDLLSSDPAAGSWKDPVEAAIAFQRCCHRHQRLGPKVTAVSGSLWHVIPEGLLRESIAAANTGNPDDLWAAFLVAYHSKDTSTVNQLLAGAPMHPRYFQIFAGFPVSTPSRIPWANPENWDATTACAAFGLSKNWRGYSKGDPIWILKYTLSATAEIFTPTVADADWNSIFRPSASRQVPHGLTIPLGPLRGRTSGRMKHPPQGLAEVVHEALLVCPAVASAATRIRYCLMVYIRDLGIHGGW